MLLDLVTEREMQVTRVLFLVGALALVGVRFTGRHQRWVLTVATAFYIACVIGLFLYALFSR